MHFDDENVLIFSPTDLVTFIDSRFGSWMDRFNAHEKKCRIKNGSKGNSDDTALTLNGLPCECDGDDEEAKLIASMGNQHEAKFLNHLKEQGHDIVDLKGQKHPQITLEAMQDGKSIIYQANLRHENFSGFADFLVREDGASGLGEHHYTVWDTKLARSVKPSFIIQLCAYSEFLEAIQKKRPVDFAVVLGNGEKRHFQVQKFFYVYRHIKQKFIAFHEQFSVDAFPHPGQERSHGRWSSFASQYLESVDHLSSVTNITGVQIRKLEDAGVRTVAELVETKSQYIPRLAQPIFERLRTQARLQTKSKGFEKPHYEVLIPLPDDPRRGLALLPPASDNDVFFDIEGFPLVQDGLEYLLGAVCVEDGQPRFVDWWAHDQTQERKSFQDFIHWVHGRWKADPTLHIYHYASYEVTAMRRLMGKHATCEQEVDELLRNHVFVDLYTVVRQGLTIGTAGYSLKDIECLYMNSREGGVTTASGSVVAYHVWMQSGESQEWQKSPLLQAIRDYNRVDCESTWMLAKWLRELQELNRISFVPPSTPESKKSDDEVVANPSRELAERMLAQVAETGDDPNAPKAIKELLAYLLEFHWREAKPVFWAMFARHEMMEQELIDDFDCLGGLERTNKAPTANKRSLNYQYRFDPEQETKLHTGSNCFLAHDLSFKISIDALDADNGLIELKVGPKYSTPPQSLSLIPDEFVSAKVISEAVFRYVDAWNSGTILSQAVDDLLNKRKPRIQAHKDGDLIPPGKDLLIGTIDVIRKMEQTVLCIQGPPGTGKTYTAAQAILRLLNEGKKIGVTANSHKAILNVLRAVHEGMVEMGLTHQIVKVGTDDDDPLIEDGSIRLLDPKAAAASIGGGSVVMGGTAWFFSRPELQEQFDYLFVDEAGQFSLANTVGVGLSAENLVLVGDQMQLAQPTLGSHPGKSGESALTYLLDGHATIPPDVGILLNQTWRLHPQICGFISASVYDNRLQSHPRTEHQSLKTEGRLITKDSGILFIPVEHEGNSQGSEEEVDAIQELFEELLEGSVWDSSSLHKSRRMTSDDILVVAPFNYQVRLLQERLGTKARVGTVDKFQGQEAHVVIVSMSSSTLEDSPRGAEFLLEPNRLNVAISRAKAMAIVVANPDLISTRCNSVRELELANLFCWLLDYAEKGEE